ncbi:hypothetical protein H310_05054 [Aphanomyces invadans]|uniref:PDZ domain-containing protein n=1 Tax=Aphanomyces invadans TaxID=157072 RepID=A0A024UBK4_9STRA|nr:hypothetical protein H310_05054 [Aphanomyces invadans]ETW03659.1 hypothetical protein H310_05054 [Aphanomyces invadans]|eukprot:XP_008867888.1 hypothetical protein H310_05054 [Aphanomyces invadans]
MSRSKAPESACVLAEFREWKKLQAKLEEDSSHACDRDTRGNLPLHWACQDPDIPLSLFESIIQAFPGGRLESNHDGQLPSHIAEKNGLSASHVQLLAVDSDANIVPTRSNEPSSSDAPQNVSSTAKVRFGESTDSKVKDHDEDENDHLASLVTQLNALRRAMHTQAKIYAQLRKHNWAASTASPPSPSSTLLAQPRDRYTLTWKRGDVGIRFFNSSVGCRVEKLSQGHGITSGIMSCRLGDVLVSINGVNVERQSVRGVMDVLQRLSTPVVLEFLPGDNIATDGGRTSGSDNDEESAAWCHSQHEMHDQVMLLLQDTIAHVNPDYKT